MVGHTSPTNADAAAAAIMDKPSNTPITGKALTDMMQQFKLMSLRADAYYAYDMVQKVR